jgi:hypothetical protein
MLTNADWVAMQNDLAAIRGDNQVSLSLRRGNTTLSAQAARVANEGKLQGRRFDNGSGEESRTMITLLFAVNADVQPEDRFTLEGRLYRVIAIRPNKRAAVMADAEMIE